MSTSIEERAKTSYLRSNVQGLTIASSHEVGYIQGATEQAEITKQETIEKSCETFCKVNCCGTPPRKTCLSLGTCNAYDRFKKKC